MNDITMGTVEAKFADIIWKGEPISSTELWKTAEREIGWKKSTTFTVLKRLCDKGLFKNEKGTVTSLISRERFYAIQSSRFVDEAFDGSLPAFLAAFAANKTLSEDEVECIKKIISGYKGE